MAIGSRVRSVDPGPTSWTVSTSPPGFVSLTHAPTWTLHFRIMSAFISVDPASGGLRQYP